MQTHDIYFAFHEPHAFKKSLKPTTTYTSGLQNHSIPGRAVREGRKGTQGS